MADELITIYSFFHRGRLVYVQAVTPDQANELFQERFGYYPTKENQNVFTEADGSV
jgi:hypothetical protein